MSPIDLLSSFSAWNTHRKAQVQSGNSPSSASGTDSQTLQKAIESLLKGFLEKLIKELTGQQGSGSSGSSGGGSPSPSPSPAPSSSPSPAAAPSSGPSPAPSPGAATPTPAPAPTQAPAPTAAAPTPDPSTITNAPKPSPTPAPPPPTEVGSGGKAPATAPSSAPTPAPSPSTNSAITKPPANMKVAEPTGVEEVNKPIIVKAGTTYDGQGKLFNAGAGLNGGGTAETQLPMFILEPGASIKNLQFKGGDGIHLLGDAKLDNVHGLQTGDDFVTVDGAENKAVDAQRAGISAKDLPSGPAQVEITNSSFQNSHDKAIQINGDVNLKLQGIYADNIGQLAVTRGGYPITANVDISDSTLQNLKAFTFRFDSKHSTINISNTDVDGGKTPVNVMAGDPSKVHGAGSVRQSVQTVG
ncbi:pectate lyase [Acidovorax sp. SUPP2522]|uniref:pectate lyase n=1 Tax=unclassified Acidovorax TaxID=2684926 RepID=UPI00234BB129|nr:MULTISPECIES: pectate lyase [unclassified Acidovorax]GKT19172.1 pectate lyase [Acidovorax sp. SUPP2522]